MRNQIPYRRELSPRLDPHPTKILIEPQSKIDIEIIEPHLELTLTQATNTFVIVLEIGKLLNLFMYLF